MIMTVVETRHNQLTMQYKPRKSNGQFRSKKNSERLFNFHVALVVVYITSPFALGLAFREDTFTIEAPHVQTVQADEQLEIIEILPAETERALSDIPHTSSTTDEVIKYIYREAEGAGIDGDAIAHTIYCESMFYNIQSGIVNNGVREPSYGLAQIHLPSHPNITAEQALNPYFAVDYLIKNWNTEKWYGYDRATDSCTNSINEYWN